MAKKLIKPWFKRLSWKELVAWRKGVDEENRRKNAIARPRNVLRRELFISEFAAVSDEFRGESRAARRNIARARSKRAYRGLLEHTR